MQLGLRMLAMVALFLPFAGLLAAQTPRGFGRLVAHEIETAQGCGGLVAPSPQKAALAPGQPLPIPLPVTCGDVVLRFTRLRLTLPLRTEPGALNGQQVSLDSPLIIAYDMAAEWTSGLPAMVRAGVTVPGAEDGVCADKLSANLNAQTSRVCEWTSIASGDDGFTVVSQFSFAPQASGGRPVFSLRSTARYAWTTAPAIERIEIVQAVQSADQRVPLFAGKPTEVRVFPVGSAAVATRVQLQIKYGAGVWRYTTPRNVLTPPQVNRNSDARSFVIPLPPEVGAAAGVIAIDAQLITAEGRLLAALAQPVNAEFVEAPPAAPLGYLRICESSADGRDRVCPDTALGSPQILGAMAEQILPVATLPQSLAGTAVVPTGPDALRRMARLRQLIEDLPIVAAVLPARGELASRLAGRSSPSLRLAFTSDAATGPEQLAAALAGVYGVTAAAGDPGTSVGFDLRSGSVIPAAASPSWVSASTVDALLSRLRARPLQPPALGGAADFLSISGTVTRDGLAGKLGHGFRVTRTAPAPPSDPSALTCLRLTAAGGESARTCFTLERLDEAATEDAFAVRLPWLAGTRQLTLLYDGVELAARTLTASPPQVDFLTPLAGNRIPDGPLVVQWSGTDADGDSLRYDLLVSADGGASWLPVVTELDRTDFTLDTSMFPTPSRVLLQLRYSDGLQSGTATTGPFDVQGAGGQIQTPANVALPPMLAGQPVDTVVTIGNSGSGALFIDSATINNPAIQLVAPSFPLQIAPGALAPLRLRVTPPSLGAFSAVIAFDGASTAARAALSGRSVNARTGQLELAPTTLDFGTATLGQTRDLPMTIGNGGGAPLTVTAARLSAAFRLSGLDEPLTLPPGGQQQVTVRFQPTMAGSAFDTLAFESDDPLRRMASLPLAGHAIAAVVANDPKIEMRPAPSADFGNVRIGVPVQQTFTLRNSGVAPLVVSQISAIPADYSIRDFPPLPFVLAPNAEQLFLVRLDAAATGARLGQLQVNSNDPVTPVLRIGLSAVASLPTTGIVVLQIDDNTFERYAGFASGDAAFLTRLKPPAYPATLKAIRVYFGERSLNAGEGFGLLWAAHPAGTEELSASVFPQSLGATVQNPAAFVEYAVPPMTIESGDFLVGFQTNRPMPAPLDISTNLTPTRSYVSREGAAYRQSVLWPGFPSGVFAVRAVVDLGGRP